MNIQRKYFTISEVAESLKVNQSYIRFIDKEYNLNLKRSKGNHYLITQDDVHTIENILALRNYSRADLVRHILRLQP